MTRNHVDSTGCGICTATWYIHPSQRHDTAATAQYSHGVGMMMRCTNAAGRPTAPTGLTVLSTAGYITQAYMWAHTENMNSISLPDMVSGCSENRLKSNSKEFVSLDATASTGEQERADWAEGTGGGDENVRDTGQRHWSRDSSRGDVPAVTDLWVHNTW